MTHILEDLSHFLKESPTSWHATLEMGNRLASVDFTPLVLSQPWHLEKGKKYFVIQDGSLIAFALPTNTLEKMALIATHTDSPALKLKPYPEVKKQGAIYLGVEVYGSPILHSWMNRDLAISGRVIVSKIGGEIEEHFVYFDDAPVFIPLLSYHLDRDGYKKGLEINPQEHLFSIATLEDEEMQIGYIESLLRRHLAFEKLHDFDLFLVPIESPRHLGRNGEMLASFRIDNLVSAHAATVALGNIERPPQSTLPMGLFFDHEEIGSSTNVGAASVLFQDVYQRILPLYSLSSEEETILRRKSLCLSVDMAHALNPNHEKRYDPNHQPLLGEGIVIKYNGNMRYATTAKSGAVVRTLCERLNLKWQTFVNRSDITSGTTVGPIFSTHTGIETADLGIAQLSMHAAREVISCQDHIDLCSLLTQFLQEGVE